MDDDSRDDERVVLERGGAEHEWHDADYVPPLPPVPLSTRLRRLIPDWADYQWARQFRVAVLALLIVGVGFFLLFGTLKGFRAEGLSMEPSLHNGDDVVVNRLAYAHIDFGMISWLPLINIDARWKTPARGDIIVFHSPVEDKELVKRVIGLPGDTVKIDDSEVVLNGAPLSEPYAVGKTTCIDACDWTVPDDSYFVLGDNRQNSLDSRSGWFVPIDNIAGKKLFTY
ncbi:MAG: signal peptidase I [Chloroflexota bacterium]